MISAIHVEILYQYNTRYDNSVIFKAYFNSVIRISWYDRTCPDMYALIDSFKLIGARYKVSSDGSLICY